MARARHKVSIDQLIEQYLFALLDRRCSEATIRWHRYHLTNFARWVHEQGSSPYPADWDRDDPGLVRRYLSLVSQQRTTRGTPRSAASLRSIQSSLRSFCRWLAATGRVQTDFVAGVPNPRLPQKLTSSFSAEEIQRLLAAIRAHSRNPWRDTALVRFMLDTGCRASEVCHLRAADIDWTSRSAKVFGKGQKERFVFFSPGVAEAMRRYEAEERPGRSPYFFESEASRQGRPLTPSGLLAICQRFGRLAGVHVHPHKFRHSFAISYLRAGGDVFSLQKRLGHTTLEMSEHYAKHVTEDLRREHDEHSPDEFLLGKGSSRSRR